MAFDRDMEVGHLNEADVHIARAEQRVTAQTMLLEQLRMGGRDTNEAERILTSFKETLEGFQEYRALIVDTIHRIDAGEI